MQQTDYIIAGGGLAGTLLALALLERGRTCRIFGGNPDLASSRVAAGVLNPVTGRRLAAGWRVEEHLAAARHTYRNLEKLTGAHFFRDMALHRFFLRESEEEFHRQRLTDPRYRAFLSARRDPGQPLSGTPGTLPFQDTLGSFTIAGAGHLDLPVFLGTAERLLQQQGVWGEGDLDYSRLTRARSCFVYDHRLTAGAVIFCEGIGILRNPWFQWLPFYPVKGESLLLEQPELSLPNAIFHHHKWIIPEGSGRFRMGSTYDRGILHPGNGVHLRPDAFSPSPAGKQQLLEALPQMLLDPPQVKVLEHRAGVRPATRDRFPYVGPHPTEAGLWVFNGLGSKGALLAPWLARQLADHLTAGHDLPAETLPSRTGIGL